MNGWESDFTKKQMLVSKTKNYKNVTILIIFIFTYLVSKIYEGDLFSENAKNVNLYLRIILKCSLSVKWINTYFVEEFIFNDLVTQYVLYVCPEILKTFQIIHSVMFFESKTQKWSS